MTSDPIFWRSVVWVCISLYGLTLQQLEGVIGLHDFHVWQLTDGMIICSLHIGVEEGVDFTKLVNEVKRVLHEAGIHSSAIQPEFVARHEVS